MIFWNFFQFLRFKIKIEYQTSTKCTALQWLEPNQTASKTHPYLFSQCQPIHCRSMVPCQDTPSVKSPYQAEVLNYYSCFSQCGQQNDNDKLYFWHFQFKFWGRGNNVDKPYDDRGEGITSTQKVGNFSHGLKFFFCWNLIWEDP